MTPSIQSEPNSALFDRWAEVYDARSNPLLMLEEQMLPPLLPAVRDQQVLDVGCGTGRWLARLAALEPTSLIGTDCSAAMLRRARMKLSHTTLFKCDATTLPVADASQDWILSSFVLSYLEDPAGFASECARALKPGGVLLLSDMHPETANQRGWKRSFEAAGETVGIAVRPQRLSEIVDLFHRHAFEVCDLREPPFQQEQRALFEEAGRQCDFLALDGVPAIYLLKLRKPPSSIQLPSLPPRGAFQLKHTRWSLDASSWDDAPLCIQEQCIVARHDHSRCAITSLDLSGYVLLPGLINAHDHLEFALFPNLGRSLDMPAYANSAEWAREIHQRHAASIADHSSVPFETRLWWGAIRNLLCGVTTVCHHNRMHPVLEHADFPVRVVTRLGWGHSLAFEPDLAKRFRATPADQPFVLHAAEGTDACSSQELEQLDAMGLLDRRTVIVHGLAFTASDVVSLNQRGASLVFCPTSNLYLFGRTPPNAFIHSIERAALGSDSPLTAAGDLLDEICYLRAEQGLDHHTLYSLTTVNPAAILHLHQGEGHIRSGGRADLIAVKATGATPADTLANLTLAQVELVLLAGRVQLASQALYERLFKDQRIGLHLLEVAGMERWIRAPLPFLFQSAEQVLGSGTLRLGGKQVGHARAY